MKEIFQLIINSTRIQKLNLLIPMVGIISCVAGGNIPACILWVLVVLQDIHIMSLQDYNQMLITSNSELLSMINTLYDSKEDDNND